MEEIKIALSKNQRISLFVVLILTFIVPTVAAANPYLIFHLDAVSAHDFYRELEEGNLPNIEALFEGGIQIKHGLSLYPGGTEMIYPRLKSGTGNHEGGSISWGYLDREADQLVSEPPGFLDLVRQFPRRSQSFFLYGIPVFHHLAELSLLNVKDILDTYGFAEVLWFHTDVVGHLLGPKAHLQSVYSFDRAIGNFLPVDQLDQVNIILYADHGMSFGDIELIDLKAIFKKTLGEYRFYSYPNVYLNEEVNKAEKAQELVANGIDFVFYRLGDTVIAHHSQGTFALNGQDGKVSYTYSGEDPFDYYINGYSGEFLSSEEWLELTKHLRFPAAPPNIYNYLHNPNVGDFVVSLIAPKLPATIRANAGNHAGLLHSDLLVPVLFKGPDLQHLEDLEHLWLHDLYSVYVSDIDFSYVPKREANSLTFFGFGSEYPGVGLQHSAKYRLRGELFAVPTQQTRIGFEYDVFSSFLSRNWLGIGAQFAGNASGFYLQVTNDVQLGRLSASSKFMYFPAQKTWECLHTLAYRIKPQLSAVWNIGKGIGLKYVW